MKNIHAYLENGTNYALCNYMISDGKGYEEEKKEFIKVINASKNAIEACSTLNNHKWTYDKFKPYKMIENGFIIKATDCWGNNSYIKVTKEG